MFGVPSVHSIHIISVPTVVCVTYIWNSVKYAIADDVYCIILSLFLAIDFFLKLLNICIMHLQNPSHNKNMYCTFQLVVVKPFSYILVRQGLNYFNAFFNKNNPIQAIYFMDIGSPGSLLVILILTCVRNPLSLYSSSIKCLTNGILINQ